MMECPLVHSTLAWKSQASSSPSPGFAFSGSRSFIDISERGRIGAAAVLSVAKRRLPRRFCRRFLTRLKTYEEEDPQGG
jgi:hypothetical protein